MRKKQTLLLIDLLFDGLKVEGVCGERESMERVDEGGTFGGGLDDLQLGGHRALPDNASSEHP